MLLILVKTYHLILKTDAKLHHVMPFGKTGLVNFILVVSFLLGKSPASVY